jgi:hypothetical protein
MPFAQHKFIPCFRGLLRLKGDYQMFDPTVNSNAFQFDDRNYTAAHPSYSAQYANGQLQFVQPNLLLAQIQPEQMKEIEAMIRRAYREEINDKIYSERNMCVALIMRMALALGLNAGIGIDSDESEWKVAFIDLPSGQVSWHIPQNEIKYFEGVPAYKGEWDSHNTEEKYKRVLTPQLEKETNKQEVLLYIATQALTQLEQLNSQGEIPLEEKPMLEYLRTALK